MTDRSTVVGFVGLGAMGSRMAARLLEAGYPLVVYNRSPERAAALEAASAEAVATPAQVALAWVLRQPDIIAIPKASTEAHVRDNADSLKIKLTKEDLTDLDREFPPPTSKKSLPML